MLIPPEPIGGAPVVPIRFEGLYVEEGGDEGGIDGGFNQVKCIANVSNDSLQVHPFGLKRFFEAYEGTVWGGDG
eukprot:CAMPEP_0198276696 /NCGR_PEP_ID=MMETSP1447-20131203/65449_1 /TAXON_ID=420782 /ORGANISM="Chaetoceros dichaeta, Strain CCMP1751" /LENGTH=73 /DNA_ID=CAMNT_0043971659 /DNA_START=1142 /DNA_END=1364 /DNA_ORIENTATION=+